MCHNVIQKQKRVCNHFTAQLFVGTCCHVNMLWRILSTLQFKIGNIYFKVYLKTKKHRIMFKFTKWRNLFQIESKPFRFRFFFLVVSLSQLEGLVVWVMRGLTTFLHQRSWKNVYNNFNIIEVYPHFFVVWNLTSDNQDCEFESRSPLNNQITVLAFKKAQSTSIKWLVDKNIKYHKFIKMSSPKFGKDV